MMSHPFIQRYSEVDGDFIIWLKEYLEVQKMVQQKNMVLQQELEMQLSDVIGLA